MKRPRWRFNGAYRLLPRLSVGFEYNPVVSELLPTANWIATPETDRWPLVSFGTSSDRIFTPEGNRAYFVSFAKGIHETGLAPYVGISYSEYENGLNFPFGVNVRLSDQWDLLPMNDGRNTHALLTYKTKDNNISFMLLRLHKPRIGISFGFGF
ncbi:MAG: hypothetical protein KIT11_10220 [Fimbriimonadaceae bacterium]|nr:hypothetical protein [Fimbriimonadaceae bacterium]QYK55697.1 MAG: hypothetical protein KF733_11890 [Fimbriimonadaceae bacterium]